MQAGGWYASAANGPASLAPNGCTEPSRRRRRATVSMASASVERDPCEPSADQPVRSRVAPRKYASVPHRMEALSYPGEGHGRQERARGGASAGGRGCGRDRGERRGHAGAPCRGRHGRADGRRRPADAGRGAAGDAPAAGRDAGGAGRGRPRHALPSRARRRACRCGRPLRDRRRLEWHVLYLDPGRVRGRRGGGAGRQARQPRGHLALRLG